MYILILLTLNHVIHLTVLPSFHVRYRSLEVWFLVSQSLRFQQLLCPQNRDPGMCKVHACGEMVKPSNSKGFFLFVFVSSVFHTLACFLFCSPFGLA